jgi:hypothetical protein
MKIERVFKEFLSMLNSKFPEVFLDGSVENEYTLFESTFFEDLVMIVQKDPKLFDTERLIFGQNLSAVWAELDDDSKKKVWRHLQTCCVHCFLHGDLNAKFDTLLGMLTPIFKSMDGYTDEIDSILGKEDTKNKFVDILEFLKNSKLLSVFIHVFESVDLSSLELGEDFEDPAKLAQNKSVIEIQQQIQRSLQSKLRTGEISQSELANDIQTIMVKVQNIFGDSMNDMLGTRKGPDAKTALSNSPEARRARMVARLQRKLDKKK